MQSTWGTKREGVSEWKMVKDGEESYPQFVPGLMLIQFHSHASYFNLFGVIYVLLHLNIHQGYKYLERPHFLEGV